MELHEIARLVPECSEQELARMDLLDADGNGKESNAT